MNKSAHTILMEIAEEKRWNTHTQLKIVLDFIEEIDNKKALMEYLKHATE